MTDKPFPEALSELLSEREWSLRELAKRTREELGWGSHTFFGQLTRGLVSPSMQAMANIAAVMRIDPAYFAEFRLGAAREALDPEVVGLAEALRALERVAPDDRR